MSNAWPSSHQPIRVLLADDQALFRRGINAVLNGEPDIEVVAEADNGSAAIEQAIELAPDLVLMDVRMPGLGGIDAARAIKTACPTASILMLTMSDEEDDLYCAIKAGASGYLLKEVSVATVADTLRSVAHGDCFLSPTLATNLLSEFNNMHRREEEGDRPHVSTLTERETQVLRHIAAGRNNEQIAETLALSHKTVTNHVRNILAKLHLQDRVEAAVHAAEKQFVNRAERV